MKSKLLSGFPFCCIVTLLSFVSMLWSRFSGWLVTFPLSPLGVVPVCLFLRSSDELKQSPAAVFVSNPCFCFQLSWPPSFCVPGMLVSALSVVLSRSWWFCLADTAFGIVVR